MVATKAKIPSRAARYESLREATGSSGTKADEITLALPHSDFQLSESPGTSAAVNK